MHWMRINLGVALFFSATLGNASARTWTNSVGRTFEADFVRVNGTDVILRLANGREFSTPLAELSTEDLGAVRMMMMRQPAPAEIVAGSFGRPWPREVRLDGPVPAKIVSEDPAKRLYVYESPNYRFSCDARVTDDALRNFAVMFEATRKYAKALPLSLAGRERHGKMDILLFGRKIDYVRAGGPPWSAGCFTRGVVMAPMESLGLKAGGTGFSLDSKFTNFVLIHELAHQLTPDAYFKPGAMGWFSEGLADYISITPYNWGYFRTDIHGSTVRDYVTTAGTPALPGRALGNKITCPPLREFFLMPYQKFTQHGAHSYGLGLLLTHYFLHMEDGGKATRITAFLKGLMAGAEGEAALKPLLGGGSYGKLEEEIRAAWARMGVEIQFGP